MKKPHYLLLLFVFILSCQKESITDDLTKNSEIRQTILSDSHPYLPAAIPDKESIDPMSGQEIFTVYEEKFAPLEEDFEWKMADDYMLWSAVKAGEKPLISIGFKEHASVFENDDRDTKEQILDFIVSELQAKQPEKSITKEDLKPEYFKFIDAFYVELDDYEILAKLRRLDGIRYVEPEYYDLEVYVHPQAAQRGGLGCGGETVTPLSYVSSPYSYQNNSRVSWHHNFNKVTGAWDHSRKGKGITIASTDTGVSTSQNLLKYPAFASGQSVGRTVVKFNETNGSSNDDCGHGTTMAGQMTGPLNNGGGLIGSAYRANLDVYKVANDVLMNTYWERRNWVDAIEHIIDRGRAKVISVAMGRTIKHSTMEDVVDEAEDEGILMVCAAGSFTGVGIYPAKYSNTVAATVVRYNPSDPNGNLLSGTSGSPSYITGTTGSHVDFSVYMRWATSGKYGAGMRRTDAQLRLAKGSSAGTAVVSGIAAMIWSNAPWLSRQQVIDRMEQASSNFPNTSSKYGWGVINAEEAVRSANPWRYDRDITGPGSGVLYTMYDFDFPSGSQSKTFFIRNKQYGYNINASNGQVTFNQTGLYQVCATIPAYEVTDCKYISITNQYAGGGDPCSIDDDCEDGDCCNNGICGPC